MLQQLQNVASCRVSLKGAARLVRSMRGLRDGSRDRVLPIFPPTSVELLSAQMQLVSSLLR